MWSKPKMIYLIISPPRTRVITAFAWHATKAPITTNQMCPLNPFFNIGAITPLGAAPAGLAQQCPRSDNSSLEVIPHICHFFLHRQNFWENKIYTKKCANYNKLHSKLPIFRVNYNKLHSKLPIFCVKSVQIYTVAPLPGPIGISMGNWPKK